MIELPFKYSSVIAPVGAGSPAGPVIVGTTQLVTSLFPSYVRVGAAGRVSVGVRLLSREPWVLKVLSINV